MTQLDLSGIDEQMVMDVLAKADIRLRELLGDDPRAMIKGMRDLPPEKHAELMLVSAAACVHNGVLGVLSERLHTPERYPDFRLSLFQRMREMPLEENLTLHGFERINSSSFFAAPDRMLAFDTRSERIRLLQSSHVASAWTENIVGFKGVDADGKAALSIITRTGARFSLNSINSDGYSSGPCPGFMLDGLEGVPFARQLEDSGVELNAYGPGIHVWAKGSKHELIIIEEEGRVTHLLEPADEYIQRRITPETRITGFAPGAGEEAEEKDKVTLTDETMEFSVSGGGHISDMWLFRELQPSEIGVKAFIPCLEHNGFLKGGVNKSSLIEGLREINCVPVQVLEDVMRPEDSGTGGISDAGFLANGESLLERLKTDNDFVLSMGLTHQEIAQPLKYAVAVSDYASVYSHRGQNFCVGRIGWAGYQESPFNDGTYTGSDYFVLNMDNGREIQFSGLLADMIERYGFYEGNTHYRLEPADVIEVFDFLKQDS